MYVSRKVCQSSNFPENAGNLSSAREDFLDESLDPDDSRSCITLANAYLLRALDMYWHEDCLKCGCCDCRLGEVGSTCYTKANLILCKRDYLRLFGNTGHCAACSKVIPAFEMVMRARTNVYHLECFACQQCNHSRSRFIYGMRKFSNYRFDDVYRTHAAWFNDFPIDNADDDDDEAFNSKTTRGTKNGHAHGGTVGDRTYLIYIIARSAMQQTRATSSRGLLTRAGHCRVRRMTATHTTYIYIRTHAHNVEGPLANPIICLPKLYTISSGVTRAPARPASSIGQQLRRPAARAYLCRVNNAVSSFTRIQTRSYLISLKLDLGAKLLITMISIDAEKRPLDLLPTCLSRVCVPNAGERIVAIAGAAAAVVDAGGTSGVYKLRRPSRGYEIEIKNDPFLEQEISFTFGHGERIKTESRA
ncbi:unnamed protein product, partial [Trichogramma brassicae]